MIRSPCFGLSDAYGFRRTPDEERIIREMLDEEIQAFIKESGIDGPAARELLSESPEIKWVVKQRGPVRQANNPSAALIGRIRDAKAGLLRPQQQAPPAFIDPSKPMSELDKFIFENRLDQNAATALRAESDEVQKMVMLRGPLMNCHSPSGAMMSRIRAARQGNGGRQPPSGSAPAMGVLPQGFPAQGLPALMGAPAQSAPAPADSPAMADMRAAAERAAREIMAQEAPRSQPSGEDAELNQEAMRAIEMLNSQGAAL
mmetsp:Transcript_67852/g.187973  ORF Transcript_67852/g.187973 Transcript_67852/m.187973 type:complete len:259 (-) Transcript_67852:58-834(-)